MLSPISFCRHSGLWVFLLALLSLCPIDLGMLYLHFHWILKSLWFLSLFLPWIRHHWVEYCSASMCLWTICCFCCYWRPLLFHVDLIGGMELGRYSYIHYLLRTVLWPITWSILEKVPWGAEKKVYAFALGWNVIYI